MTIFPIPALNDNYIWIILHPASSQALVVDPGEAAPVFSILEQKAIELTGILLTHHHWDHTGGVKDLVKAFAVPVYGPASIPLVSMPVKEGDRLNIDAPPCGFKVIEIPGHTLDHIAYISDTAVFCGDTLFTGGCGRVFEGTFPQMYASLQKLAALPPDTMIYCAHEYTLANLSFAKTVEPNNQDIQNRIAMAKKLRAEGMPTIPAPLSMELKTNPFLRCDKNSVQLAANTHSQQNLADPVDIFTEIRSWKDRF